MAWTPEDRRRHAPALQEVVRQGMLVRLAAMIDTIHPPSSVGRQGFQVEPRRWKVEQTFGCLQRYPRSRPPGLQSRLTRAAPIRVERAFQGLGLALR
jgi:hypothetical protein